MSFLRETFRRDERNPRILKAYALVTRQVLRKTLEFSDDLPDPLYSGRNPPMAPISQQSSALVLDGGRIARVSSPARLFDGDLDQRPSFRPSYDVARDGRLLMVGSPAPASPDEIAVLLNWRRP